MTARRLRVSIARPAFLLVTGRTFGFAVSFVIPLVLARTFNRETFGTYRELFLLYTTLYGLAQVGMSESLYYFVPREPDHAARSLGNALMVLVGAGLLCGVSLCVAAGPLARWFRNDDLTTHVPVFAVFLALMLVASTLEIVLISRERYKQAAIVYASSDTVKALLFCVPAILFRSLTALLVGAVMFAMVRCVALGRYVVREYERKLAIDVPLLKRQLAYAIPFAAAATLEIVQSNWHQYAVASWFDGATFAIYSVGCLQIPLVDLLSTSTANVMMVRMSGDLAHHRQVLTLWHQTVERLAGVFLPLFLLITLTSRELIVTLFTERYSAAAPIFVVSSLGILLAAFPVDAALRVYAQTRVLLLLMLLRLAVTTIGIGSFVSRWSLVGAALITVTAMAAAKVVAIGRIAHLMGVGISSVLPWRSLAWSVTAAVVALGPALWFKSHVAAPPLQQAMLTGLVYGLTYLAIVGCLQLGWHNRASQSMVLEPGTEN
jgi:O-antigen/teichoic acid export membrane protein